MGAKKRSLLSRSLLGSLGGLAGLDLSGDLFDDTDGDSLAHITHGETTERGVGGERLNDHGLGGDELNEGGILRFDVGGVLLSDCTSTLVDLSGDLAELASDVTGVAIEDGGIAVLDGTRVVEDDDLSEEHLGIRARVVLRVGGDVTSLDILDGQVLNVETNVISGLGLFNLLVVHFD